MHEDKNQTCLCPLKGIIDIISKKWALLIINTIGNCGKLRFNQIMGTLSGISPKTLSETLKELCSEGLVSRESFAEIPPRVEYSLTNDGIELRKSIIPLLEWTANREYMNKKRCKKCPPEMRKRYTSSCLGEKK